MTDIAEKAWKENEKDRGKSLLFLEVPWGKEGVLWGEKRVLGRGHLGGCLVDRWERPCFRKLKGRTRAGRQKRPRKGKKKK